MKIILLCGGDNWKGIPPETEVDLNYLEKIPNFIEYKNKLTIGDLRHNILGVGISVNNWIIKKHIKTSEIKY